MDDQQWNQYNCGPDIFTERISGGTITFGGVVNSRNFLCVNGDALSVLNSDAQAVGNSSFMGIASRPYAVAWSTQSGTENTTFLILQNGSPAIPFDFAGQGASGVINISVPIVFRPGNSFQLRHVDGTPPGPSTVTVYMTPVFTTGLVNTEI
jgi:hypothetical protein